MAKGNFGQEKNGFANFIKNILKKVISEGIAHLVCHLSHTNIIKIKLKIFRQKKYKKMFMAGVWHCELKNIAMIYLKKI